MNVESFFQKLPPEEFQIFETELREALIQVAAKAADLRLPGNRFPLQQWIDRRLGGEVRASEDAKGQLEISLVVAAAAYQRADEAFFGGLSQDSFSKEEEALRESIFDFLAAWNSPELATLKDLCSDANVSAKSKAFLPNSVTLSDWIERRIGGEVELDKEVVKVVSDEARQVVQEKYQALLRSRQPSGKGKAGKGGLSGKDWLERLPPAELTGEEVNLRQALLDCLDQRRRAGKGKGSAPLLGDVMQAPRVTQSRLALLPTNVSLKDWIEARIGAEVELRQNARGQMEVVRLGGSSEAPAAPALAFLDTLPAEALNDQELELREAVLAAVASWPCTLKQLGQNALVAQAAGKLLPEEVALREWIDRRIGGEVEVDADEWVSSRSKGAEEPEPEVQGQGPEKGAKGGKGAGKSANGKGVEKGKGPDKGKGKNGKGPGADSTRAMAESFFGNLPADHFTSEEEKLRDAILGFLEHWGEEDAPTLSKAMLDPEVRKCKQEVLPKGNVVSLKEWIERRLGGELEITRGESGNLIIGIRGDLETGKREAAEDWEQGGGKAPRLE